VLTDAEIVCGNTGTDTVSQILDMILPLRHMGLELEPSEASFDGSQNRKNDLAESTAAELVGGGYAAVVAESVASHLGSCCKRTVSRPGSDRVYPSHRRRS